MLVLLDTDPQGKLRADILATVDDVGLYEPLFEDESGQDQLAEWLLPAVKFQAMREWLTVYGRIGLDSPHVDGLWLGPQPGATFVATLPVAA